MDSSILLLISFMGESSFSSLDLHVRTQQKTQKQAPSEAQAALDAAIKVLSRRRRIKRLLLAHVYQGKKAYTLLDGGEVTLLQVSDST